MRARAAWPERPTRVTRACAPGSFWAVFMLNHLLIAFVLCSPCDVYGVLLGVVLMGYFWNCTCSPPAYDKASPSQTQGSGTFTAQGNVETKWTAMSTGLPGELVKISSQPLG